MSDLKPNEEHKETWKSEGDEGVRSKSEDKQVTKVIFSKPPKYQSALLKTIDKYHKQIY